ncbi:MAG: cation transporter [Planctomycetota bacterium]
MSKMTHPKSVLLVLLSLSCLLLVSSQADAAEKKEATTTVTVGEMCMGCVKQITARFDQEKSVSKVTCDIKKKTVTLVPAKDVRLSAREIWEIMEGIRKKPLKLVGPEGTFTSKPKKG